MTFSRHAVAAGAVGLGLALAAVATLAPMVAAAGPDDVSIVDQSFQPTDLTINAGQTVTWTVTKAIGAPHSVTSGSPGDSNPGSVFDSKFTLVNNGDTFKFTFSNPGTYPYYCQVHPTTMRGTITVSGSGGSGPPPAASSAPSAAPPATAAPAASGAPAASAPPTPPGADKEPVPASDKAIAAGIIGVALVILFGSAAFYRRMNRG
jgi:plastocyanin